MDIISPSPLADDFYRLSELEFLHPRKEFQAEQKAVRRQIDQLQNLAPIEFQKFARELIQKIALRCCDRESNKGALYRAFDSLDEIFAINYQEDRLTEQTSERIYEGGGVGVQTSYSTILQALDHLKLPSNSHLVDLGSGFGRVGLTAGLWREDLRFSGYEFVGHRVEMANAAAKKIGIEDRVRFFQQDLSATDFEIPAADVYYLYDPFTSATYQNVFSRLDEVARVQATVILTKDDGRENFLRWMNRELWSESQTLDEGTLTLFKSKRLP